MKVHWEEKDIIAGRIVCKPPSYQSNKDFKPCGNAAKWTYKIGFGWWGEKSEKFYTLNSFTDGLILKVGKTAQEVADKLNKEEMIPMPHNWVIQIMDFLRDCYEN